MVSRNPLSSRPSLPRNVTIQYQGDNARARALPSEITGPLTGTRPALHTSTAFTRACHVSAGLRLR